MKRCINNSLASKCRLMTISLVLMSGSLFGQTVDDVLKADAKRLQLAQA